MISFNAKSEGQNNESGDPRERRKEQWSKLNDYKKHYTSNEFIEDLQAYFDNGVDFDLETIRRTVSKKGELDKLKKQADVNGSHPVTEFLLEIFKDSFR